MRRLPRVVLVALIRFYQLGISPFLPPSCRFAPTCSEYTRVAIERFGVFKGLWLGLCRLGKCHPFHPGGYDPVPEPHASCQSVPAAHSKPHPPAG